MYVNILSQCPSYRYTSVISTATNIIYFLDLCPLIVYPVSTEMTSKSLTTKGESKATGSVYIQSEVLLYL